MEYRWIYRFWRKPVIAIGGSTKLDQVLLPAMLESPDCGSINLGVYLDFCVQKSAYRGLSTDRYTSKRADLHLTGTLLGDSRGLVPLNLASPNVRYWDKQTLKSQRRLGECRLSTQKQTFAKIELKCLLLTQSGDASSAKSWRVPNVRLTIISDTHNQHEALNLPGGDVLIHCGDMFELFLESENELERMDKWFGTLAYDVIFCTGGNHDRSLEQKLLCTDSPFVNAVYLQDEATDYRGIRFYGSPWTPLLPTHAFYGAPKKREHAWRSIPSDTDVLITHTPPAGILDKSGAGLDLGCRLLSRELERIKPRIHCFGHVHASRGVFVQNGTTFVNASSVDYRHETPFPPINVDL